MKCHHLFPKPIPPEVHTQQNTISIPCAKSQASQASKQASKQASMQANQVLMQVRQKKNQAPQHDKGVSKARQTVNLAIKPCKSPNKRPCRACCVNRSAVNSV